MKLAILDKDGTLTQPKSGAKFVQSPDDQELIPGVKEAIAALVADGYVLAIASNQGGVTAINPATGEPYKTLEDAIAEMRYCMELIPAIEFCLFCPDLEGEQCWAVQGNGEPAPIHLLYPSNAFFRKPGDGMIKGAIKCWGSWDIKETIFVGDRPEDEAAAITAGIPFIHAEKWRKGSPHE